MLALLREERVATWFDLGLFLDRLREDRPGLTCRAPADLPAFERGVAVGVGFLTFNFGIDGVSMEIAKYAEALRRFLGNPKIHYIAGHFEEFSDHVIDPTDTWHRIETMRGFDEWPSYRDFFSRKLDRGGPLYNQLIGKLWSEVLRTCERLGAIVEAILAKRPIFVNNYKPVFWPDIGSKGLKCVMLEDNQLTDEALAEVDEILHNPELRKEIAEHNFRLGREHFSYEVLQDKLEELFSF